MILLLHVHFHTVCKLLYKSIWCFACLVVPTKFLLQIGHQGTGPDALFMPIGVTSNSADDVIVCDTRHNLVKIFRSDGSCCRVIDKCVRVVRTQIFSRILQWWKMTCWNVHMIIICSYYLIVVHCFIILSHMFILSMFILSNVHLSRSSLLQMFIRFILA
jgi:NHL repeat